MVDENVPLDDHSGIVHSSAKSMLTFTMNLI